MGYRQILCQLVEVKGLQSIVKNCYLHFGRSNTCKREERGFDGRRPKSSWHQQQQKHRQQQAATGTQATRKAATSSRNNNPEKVRAKRCGSRRWWEREASSRGIGCNQICNNWSLTFSEVLWGKSIVKLFFTFCKSHRGFTRQPVSQTCTVGTDASKHHQNSTRRSPREREKERKWEREREKRGDILGGPAEGESVRAPKSWTHRRKF